MYKLSIQDSFVEYFIKITATWIETNVYVIFVYIFLKMNHRGRL